MKRRLARKVATTACTAAAVAALAASNATAAPASPSSQPPPAGAADQSAQPRTTMLQAVQRDLGLSAAQAEQRLAREASANTTDHQLRTSLPDTYGGAHYDPRRGRLVVGVTDRSAFDRVRASGAEPVLVQHTADQLAGAASNLGRARAPKSVTGWYVDPVRNQVVITTARGTAAQAREFAASSGADPSAVRVEETDRKSVV